MPCWTTWGETGSKSPDGVKKRVLFETMKTESKWTEKLRTWNPTKRENRMNDSFEIIGQKIGFMSSQIKRNRNFWIFFQRSSSRAKKINPEVKECKIFEMLLWVFQRQHMFQNLYKLQFFSQPRSKSAKTCFLKSCKVFTTDYTESWLRIPNCRIRKRASTLTV